MRILRQLCRHPKKWPIRHVFQVFFVTILSVSLLVAMLLYLFSRPDHGDFTHELLLRHEASQNHHSQTSKDGTPNSKVSKKKKPFFRLLPWDATPTQSLFSSAHNNWSSTGTPKCSLFTCLDIHRCGSHGHSLSLYLYPVRRWEVDGVALPPPSKQFLQIVNTLRRSTYWVADPKDACIFVPTVDTLYMTEESTLTMMRVLSSLPHWGQNGKNHLIFTFTSSGQRAFLSSEAIVASVEFPVSLYQPGFNIPLILPNPLLSDNPKLSIKNDDNISNKQQKKKIDNEVVKKRKNQDQWFRDRKFVAISTTHLPFSTLEDPGGILVLDVCKGRPLISYWERCSVTEGKLRVFSYPQVLQQTDFCIIYRNLGGPLLWDIMSVGCIPVILADFQRLPFDDVLDWSRMAILVYEQDLDELSSILRGVSERRKLRLKAQVKLVFTQYFENMGRITETVLEVVQDRIFSHQARPIHTWNHHPTLDLVEQPLFNPASAPGEVGFTAVILAYERVPSLFQVISRLDKVPSLAKIIVVWNNQKKRPPPYSAWPVTSKAIKVVQMTSNKMSNRFFPFDEIETEAVFSLDDDIVMLTTDEVEFGFQTWREFPDRIVGFPSRTHIWDNTTKRWRYESEWMNQVSMVLTGAAFYHKYWHHAFTHEMPASIRNIVDDTMNCEDIAINFLVAATTGQPPIKVTPRKKFKCPTCSNNEMLSSDSSHMIERTQCVNRFAEIYGYMPLLTAEWRADPVLYRNQDAALSLKLKKYKDVGSL